MWLLDNLKFYTCLHFGLCDICSRQHGLILYCLLLYRKIVSWLPTVFLREVKTLFLKVDWDFRLKLSVWLFLHVPGRLITVEENSLLLRLFSPNSTWRNITLCALCRFLFSLCAILSSIISSCGYYLYFKTFNTCIAEWLDSFSR